MSALDAIDVSAVAETYSQELGWALPDDLDIDGRELFARKKASNRGPILSVGEDRHGRRWAARDFRHYDNPADSIERCVWLA